LPRQQDKTMIDRERARNQAEAAFKRKEEARIEGLKAMEEYRAGQRAMREKTARLKALRLAREQAGKRT
jgi:hypothetical protein